jgi:hypothetical protein
MTIASPQMDELANPPRARTARRRQSPADYLAAMDAALARLPLAQRVAIMEDAICRADRAERALFNWAAGMGGGEPPVPFTAFEISAISIELSKRLAAARDEERGQAMIAAE